jgi:hypothetical protein
MDSLLDEQYYEANIRIQVSNAIQARALATFFAIAGAFLPAVMDTENTAGINPAVLLPILLANPPVLDGNSLLIKTNPMDTDVISLLINTFLL